MPALASVVAAAKPDKPAPMIWMGPACAMTSHVRGWFQGCGSAATDMRAYFHQEAPEQLDVDNCELIFRLKGAEQLFHSSGLPEDKTMVKSPPPRVRCLAGQTL